jgi:hypothetical protein
MKLKTKEDIEKYVKENEMDIQSARSNMIAMSIAFSAYSSSKKFNGVGFSPMFCYMVKDDFFSQLTPMSGLNRVSKNIAELAMEDVNKIRKLSAEHVKTEEEIDKLWKKMDFKEDGGELIRKFKEMLVRVEKWWFYAGYGEDKGKRLGEMAIDKIMKTRGVDYNRANEIVSILSHPNEKSIFTQERIDFLEICRYLLEKNVRKSEISRDKKFDKMYKEYLDEYFFNKTDFKDRKVITKEVFIGDILKEIESKSKEQINSDLDKIDSDNKRLMDEKVKLLGKIRLSDEEKAHMIAVEEMITWLDNRKRDMMKHFYYIFSIIHELSDRFNVKYEDLFDNNRTY